MAGEQVLVVEDNEMNMKLSGTSSRRRAIGRWRRRPARRRSSSRPSTRRDLVLMDIQLPDIDGVEALMQLRADARTASIPVLALTAQAMDGDRERFLAAGFDGYVSKPVNVVELIGTVRHHCDGARSMNPRPRNRPPS